MAKSPVHFHVSVKHSDAEVPRPQGTYPDAAGAMHKVGRISEGLDEWDSKLIDHRRIGPGNESWTFRQPASGRISVVLMWPCSARECVK